MIKGGFLKPIQLKIAELPECLLAWQHNILGHIEGEFLVSGLCDIDPPAWDIPSYTTPIPSSIESPMTDVGYGIDSTPSSQAIHLGLHFGSKNYWISR